MFDQSRAKQLQQKSHTRGMLSKQFYSQEQMELQRKRRQMKNILDQQVQQKRRKKQSEKLQQDRKLKREEQQLKYYYANLQQRQKKNSSIVQNMSNNHSKSNLQAVYNDPNQSRVRQHYQQSIQNIRQRVNSKSTLAENDGDIPLLPVMALSDNNYANSYSIGSNAPFQQQNYNFQKKQLGNIPLLDLGDQGYNNQNAIKIKKKTKAPTKRQKTYERQNFHIGSQQTIIQHVNQSKKFNVQSFGNQSNSYQTTSNQPYSPPSYQHHLKNSLQGREQRKKTYSDQQGGSVMMSLNHIQSSKVSRGQFHEVTFKSPNSKEKRQTQIPEEIQQYQNENKQLKNQLKKSQQAISLLIGAVRSNAKLDKFRVQAQRILHAQNESIVREHKTSKEKIEQQLMLPKLTLRHQSIMHDYMINAAKKNHKSKTFKY